MFSGAEVVYCPAGIRRSSPNDVRKRHTFDWESKYNNIYVKLPGGLIVEGMNDQGFSASLMFLENSVLPGSDKVHIPIAVSLSVNFFIDHFNSVDTALLAIWDIRLFDDLAASSGWPFRIVLHDSTGATACFEYVEGQKRVYTPDPPSLIVDGPNYARLLTLRHISDSIPLGKAEHRFMDLDKRIREQPLTRSFILGLMEQEGGGLKKVIVERDHQHALMSITDDTMSITIDLRKSDLFQAREVPVSLF